MNQINNFTLIKIKAGTDPSYTKVWASAIEIEQGTAGQWWERWWVTVMVNYNEPIKCSNDCKLQQWWKNVVSYKLSNKPDTG